jgi:hypothetical protein
MQYPATVTCSADGTRANQVTHRRGYGWPVRSDKVREPLMGQGQRHRDPIACNPPPAIRQVPERQQQPFIDALMVGDRQANGERMGAPGATGEELDADLRPGIDARHQTVIEHRQIGWLQHNPPHLGMDVRAIGIPAPWAQDVARSQQLDAPAAEHINFAREQAVDDEKPAVMQVRLGRVGGIPFARRQATYAGQRLALCALALRLVEQVCEVRIGVDDADQVSYRAHAGSRGAVTRIVAVGRLVEALVIFVGAEATGGSKDGGPAYWRPRPSDPARRIAGAPVADEHSDRHAGVSNVCRTGSL